LATSALSAVRISAPSRFLGALGGSHFSTVTLPRRSWRFAFPTVTLPPAHDIGRNTRYSGESQMPRQVHERFRWAIDKLGIQPEHRVLEIGCGHGFAVALLCDHLTTGHVTAMDRSDKMIDVARKRNAACADAGKVAFVTGSLEDSDFEDGAFDRIFAFNVNVFWTEPGVGLDKIRRWLAPAGTFSLFYMPPSGEWVQYYIDSLSATLEANGFTVRHTYTQPMDKSAVLVVTATR
jgi:SAM-dependent methyltransferase